MTDVFLDRVSQLAGRTARVLDAIAQVLEEQELVNQAKTLRRVADDHKKIALDCLTETQPIEVRRLPIGRQLRNLAEESRQVAAELMQRGIPGHTKISEAAQELDEVADLADKHRSS